MNKNNINKTFLVNRNHRWLDKIANIVHIYNNTPHISLDGLTPSQALKPQNFNKIVRINMLKKEQTKRTSDLEIGDQVRKYILLKKNIITKPSMEPNMEQNIKDTIYSKYQTLLKEILIIYINYMSCNKLMIITRIINNKLNKVR